MAAAALTPRVRLAIVCDRVRESVTEAGVYHLRGVRQQIVAPAFPFLRTTTWRLKLEFAARFLTQAVTRSKFGFTVTTETIF